MSSGVRADKREEKVNMRKGKGPWPGLPPSLEDFMLVKNVIARDGSEWEVYFSREANEGRGGVLWRNIKLCAKTPHRKKGNFSFGWNGQRFGEGSETFYLKKHSPELLAQVREALREALEELEPVNG
jgi:hypothetical protein